MAKRGRGKDTGIVTVQGGNPHIVKLHYPRRDKIKGWKCCVTRERRRRELGEDDEADMHVVEYESTGMN